MYVTFCGKFVPNERGVVGYVKRIRGKSPAKWGVQMAGMNFQTRPNGSWQQTVPAWLWPRSPVPGRPSCSVFHILF
ncbi:MULTISPECIES: DUF6783 domain-containing protein [Hungatella]|uniref:DUF6783 domain-containing protein n=1 Tax=Hungatella TaxID=1649459 RepID=UPI002A82D1BF|nr:DUF6783 domain-containing protein [Hungatella sp.]